MNEENRYIAIGAKIREAREATGLSQKALAEKLGYESSTAVSYIESGERKVAVVDLEKIAGILDREVGFFIGLEAQPMNVRVALRAEEGLDKKDQDAILHIIEMAKKRAGGN
jgi:transcriptional regulator with XRE-family HTH domain